MQQMLHHESGSLKAILDCFEERLTANSIMTPWKYVDFVDTEKDCDSARNHAEKEMKEKQYSAMPAVWGKKIHGVYLRRNPHARPKYRVVEGHFFTKSKTSLFDLIDHMHSRKLVAMVIGTPIEPCGWVTYADFSKRTFRLLLFTLIAEVESLLADALERCHPNDDWVHLLPNNPDPKKDLRGKLEARKSRAEEWDATMPITTFAELGHLVTAVAASQSTVRLLGTDQNISNDLENFRKLRNRVAHVVKPVVAGPNHLSGIAVQIKRLRGWVNDWSKRLPQKN